MRKIKELFGTKELVKLEMPTPPKKELREIKKNEKREQKEQRRKNDFK